MSFESSSTNNTSNLGRPISSPFAAAASRQRKAESRSLAENALRPDPTAVAADQTRCDREAHAVPRELLARVKAFEDTEELVRIAHVEADAVVAHRVDRLVRLLVASDFHLRGNP